MIELKVWEEDYFGEFACKASACRTSCCGGWDITLSKAEYLGMKNDEMPAGISAITKTAMHRIRKNSSDQVYAGITLNEKKECPYLSEEHLCTLQSAMGAGVLSKTCRLFPRVTALIGTTLYRTLTMGCEAVTEHLLTMQTPLTLHSHNLAVNNEGEWQELLHTVDHHGDQPFFHELFFVSTSILQNAGYTVPERLQLLSLALSALPQQGKLQEAFPAWFVKYAPMAQGVQYTLPPADKAAMEEAVKAAAMLAGVNAAAFNAKNIVEALGALGVKLAINSESNTATGEYSKEAYARAKGLLDDIFAKLPLAQENIMVSVWHWLLLASCDDAYAACRTMCALYAMLRIVLLGHALEGMDMAHLEDVLTFLMRRWLHNKTNLTAILQSLDDSGYSTPAHMAILLAI